MFSDLTGYTALNEAADPEEVEAIMGRIKAEATAVIERHGGTVNQFVGDEIMALFGVPLARRDDPRRAVAAALELHAAVDAWSPTLEPAPGRPCLSMHTGINTGLVVARRSDARAGDYALTGDTVNTAARLRSLAGPGEVRRQRRHLAAGVRPSSTLKRGAPAEVKGKERPLSPYRVRGERAAPAAGAGPLVGRDEELRDFAAVAAACAERQAQPRRRRPRRSRASASRGSSPSSRPSAATLGFSCHAAAVLDFGAETGRDAIRSLARSLLGVAGNGRAGRAPGSDRARRRGPVDRRRAPAVPLRPARRRAAARAARARRGDEHGGARAGVAARPVRAGDGRRQRPRRSSSWSRTSTGPTPGRSSAWRRSPCSPRGSRCCWS